MPNTDDANKDDRGTAHALRHAGRRTSPRMRTTAHAFSAAPTAGASAAAARMVCLSGPISRPPCRRQHAEKRFYGAQVLGVEDAAHYAGGTEVKDEVRSHICGGTGLTPSTSAPGLGSPLPHLRRGLGSPLPHLRRDWAHLIATSAPGLAGGPGHRGGRDASHEDDHDLAARGGTLSTRSTLSTLSTLSAAGCADHWCARACV